MICKYKYCCEVFNENDPEYIRWMGIDGKYCREDCELKQEIIEMYGDKIFKKTMQKQSDELSSQIAQELLTNYGFNRGEKQMNENLEKIAEAADTLDNLTAALCGLGVPPRIHLEVFKAPLSYICCALKRIGYLSMNGLSVLQNISL